MIEFMCVHSMDPSSFPLHWLDLSSKIASAINYKSYSVYHDFISESVQKARGALSCPVSVPLSPPVPSKPSKTMSKQQKQKKKKISSVPRLKMSPSKLHKAISQLSTQFVRDNLDYFLASVPDGVLPESTMASLLTLRDVSIIHRLQRAWPFSSYAGKFYSIDTVGPQFMRESLLASPTTYPYLDFKVRPLSEDDS